LRCSAVRAALNDERAAHMTVFQLLAARTLAAARGI
jgi:hypothetical protein